MKAFNYFTLITLATLSVACNEKISPKLLDANQSTTVPPIIEPDVYSFQVKNISPEGRKFHLHKAGIGNFDTPCEIKTTDKFTSNLYRDSLRNPEFDISCFFEAEELSLSNGGFSFQFEATPNTCEYVGYAPFSFYNFQPGDSSATYTQITCGKDVGNGDPRLQQSPNIRDANNDWVKCNSLLLNEGAGPGLISNDNALPLTY